MSQVLNQQPAEPAGSSLLKPQKHRAHRTGFLLLPNYSLIAFSSAIEPLRMANLITGENLYEHSLISHDGKAVASSAGVVTKVDCGIRDAIQIDTLFVVGASPVARTGNENIIAWLRQQKQNKAALGGIGTGSYLLACAGLLDGCRATIHWWDYENLRDEFPLIRVTNNLFEVDGQRYTCSGGTAAMDMMLFLIGQRHGMELAASISEQFVCERIRTAKDPQRVPLQHRIGARQPKLVEAVTLMESNIEEPLSTDDIAFHVGLSRRHLERLFKKHLQAVPSRFYFNIRMEKARRLLRESDKSILQVGLACGFTSASHFSTAYKTHYGQTPREERKALEAPDSLHITLE